MRKRNAILICCVACIVLILLFAQDVLNVGSVIDEGVAFINDPGIFGSMVNSTFHEAYCEEDYIYYRCDIVLRNYTSMNKKLKVSGIMMAEYLYGCLASPFVEMIDINGSVAEIMVLPTCEYQYYDDVIFRGKKGEKTEFIKADRSAPIMYLR